MKALLRLYPRRWRRLYEPEMEALLEQTPATPKAAFDLVRGALDAHLHREWRGCTPAPSRRPHRTAGWIITAAALVAANLGITLLALRTGLRGVSVAAPAATVSGILLATVALRFVRRRRRRRGPGPQDPGQGAQVPASPLPDAPPALAAASRGSGRRSGPE
jgi:Flp pilus assembly protein TadB